MKNLKNEIEKITILYETAREEGSTEEHKRVVEELLNLFESIVWEITPEKNKSKTPHNSYGEGYKNGFNDCIEELQILADLSAE